MCSGKIKMLFKIKEDLMQKVGSEIIKNLNKIDLVKVMTQFAQEHKFKIHAEIEFEKKKKEEPSDSDSNPPS